MTAIWAGSGIARQQWHGFGSAGTASERGRILRDGCVTARLDVSRGVSYYASTCGAPSPLRFQFLFVRQTEGTDYDFDYDCDFKPDQHQWVVAYSQLNRSTMITWVNIDDERREHDIEAIISSEAFNHDTETMIEYFDQDEAGARARGDEINRTLASYQPIGSPELACMHKTPLQPTQTRYHSASNV